MAKNHKRVLLRLVLFRFLTVLFTHEVTMVSENQISLGVTENSQYAVKLYVRRFWLTSLLRYLTYKDSYNPTQVY